jgi:integrase
MSGVMLTLLMLQRCFSRLAMAFLTAPRWAADAPSTSAVWRSKPCALLTWDCVDLDGKDPSWHIPEHRSKTGGERTLPLASQAVDVLRAQPHCPRNPYVFTGRNGKGHVGHPAGTWSKVSAVAGLHVSAHSMRRTFTNIALKPGIEMWKVELLTSHVPTTTTLVHYTDTADLRETCAREIQRLGNWVATQAAIAARGRAWLRAA